MIKVAEQKYNLELIKKLMETTFEDNEGNVSKWKAYVFMRETVSRVERDIIGLLFLGYPILTSYNILGTPYMLESVSKTKPLPKEDFFFREITPSIYTYYVGRKETLREIGLPSIEMEIPPILEFFLDNNDIEPPEKAYLMYHYSISENLERQIQKDGFFYADIVKEIKDNISQMKNIATFKK